jgi:hypothetical protein
MPCAPRRTGGAHDIRTGGHVSSCLALRAGCLLDDARPTPTPIGGVPLDVIRYIASAFLSEASAATLSRSENSGVSELSEPEGGHPA